MSKTIKKTLPKKTGRGGRPSKYNSKFCVDIVEFMAKGNSLTQFAASIGVCKDTVYEWIKVHPRFSDAFRFAKTNCEAYWQERLKGFMEKRNVNAPLVKLYFANMFGWSDKVETNTTVSLSDELKSLAAKLPD